MISNGKKWGEAVLRHQLWPFAWTGSNYPDLVIGGIVGGIVLIGAKRILALKG